MSILPILQDVIATCFPKIRRRSFRAAAGRMYCGMEGIECSLRGLVLAPLINCIQRLFSVLHSQIRWKPLWRPWHVRICQRLCVDSLRLIPSHTTVTSSLRCACAVDCASRQSPAAWELCQLDPRSLHDLACCSPRVYIPRHRCFRTCIKTATTGCGKVHRRQYVHSEDRRYHC